MLAIITTTPVSMPGIGPSRIAAEIVALVAHSVVGQDWLSSAHWSEATNSVDSISATTTTISASTQARRAAEPLQIGDRAGHAPADQHREQQPSDRRVGRGPG